MHKVAKFAAMQKKGEINAINFELTIFFHCMSEQYEKSEIYDLYSSMPGLYLQVFKEFGSKLCFGHNVKLNLTPQDMT